MSLASILIAILSFIVILIIFRYLISSVNTKIIHDGKEQKYTKVMIYQNPLLIIVLIHFGFL